MRAPPPGASSIVHGAAVGPDQAVDEVQPEPGAAAARRRFQNFVKTRRRSSGAMPSPSSST